MSQEITNYNNKITANNDQITSLKTQVSDVSTKLQQLETLKTSIVVKYNFTNMFRTLFGQRDYKNEVSKNVNNEHAESMSAANYNSMIHEIDAEITNVRARLTSLNGTISNLNSQNQRYSTTIVNLRKDMTK